MQMNFGSAELDLLLDKEHQLLHEATPDFTNLSKIMTQLNVEDKEVSNTKI